MADTKYTYAVARIRAKEVSLFSDSDIEQLLSCKDYDTCLTFLREHGWGSGEKNETAEEMLSSERKKTWEEMEGVVQDKSIFSVLTIPNEYHNLKAAIKQVCSGDTAAHAYYENSRWEPAELMSMIEKREFSKLPDDMAKAAAEATEALLHTEDGQLCDIIMDKAALEALIKAGDESDSKLIRDYAQEAVAVADIRIAVRCAKTGKSREFIERAMVSCDRISLSALIKSTLLGVDEICSYLESSGYIEASESIKESSSAFERWCDNRVIQTINSQKYNSFSSGPVIAYILARENEIKTVRIILTGKINSLNEEFIRERLRKMYV